MKKIYLTILLALVASVGMSWATTNSITINESSHGSVVASSSSAAAGETITLTATPDDGYHLKSISGVYETPATSSETLNSVKTKTTITGTKFQCVGTDVNNYGWRVYNPGTANTLTVSSLNGTTLINKIEFTSTWGAQRTNDMLSVSAGTLSFNGTPATTVTINNINATSVTISGSGNNAAKTWCINSVKVYYYEGTEEVELEISDTENANVKTFTMVDSEVTISAEFEPDVYTVAGVAALCGVEWANDAVQNDMTYSEGAFRWASGPVYYDGTSTWGFRVVKDHTWTGFPDGNYDIKSDWKLTSGAGYYNVEIAYTTAPQAIEVTATYLYPKVEVAGDFNEWAHEKLTYNPSGYFYKNIPLTAGSREFKVLINDAWYGNNGTMTRVDCENKTFVSEANNCHLLADVDGYYTFYYQNDLVSVSYPTTFTRVVNNTNYQTLCVPFDAVKPANVAIYEVTNVTESSVTIGTPDIAYLEAGHSYIIKPEAEADIVINMKDEGAVVAAPINTHMFGILGADFQPTAALGAYILSENEFHLVAADGVATVSSTRAYVKVTDPNAAPALRIVEAGNEATDIQNIEGNETAVKFIENGQLFIKKNGVVYDAVGTVVK